MSKKAWISAVLVAAALWTSAGSASAADGNIEVSVQIGNENVTVNGEPIKVAKPYLSNNITLVPLRVITTAFGAEVTWNSSTNSILLTYNGSEIELTIGSKTVKAGGVASTLEAAPELSGGTTMVPLRFITQSFGAEVEFDAATQTITIRKNGTAGSADGQNDVVLDQDAGKTHIGDSHYGWSMSYLPELDYERLTFSGDVVRFNHLQDEFTITVLVGEDQPALSSQGLLNKLIDFVGDVKILSQSYVRDGGYAKVVSENDDGSISETRAYAKGDKQYLIDLTTDKENFDNKQRWASYVDLLDTFRLSFDRTASSYKDIANVSDGYALVEMNEYGVEFRIPANWYVSEASDNLMEQYVNEDGDQYFQSQVSSRKAGDTVEAWAGRVADQYYERYVEKFVKIGELEPITVGGIAGSSRINSTFTGSSWTEELEVFLMKGDYKYYFAVGVPEELPEAEKEKLREQLISSVRIDPSQMDPNLGELFDSWDNTNYERRFQLTNKKAKYTIDIPEYWEESENHDGGYAVEYFFGGGRFAVFADPTSEITAAEAVMGMDSSNREREQQDPSFELKSKSTVSMYGVTATKYDIAFKESGVQVFETYYFFEKAGLTYLILYTTLEHTATKSVLDRIAETIQSIEFSS